MRLTRWILLAATVTMGPLFFTACKKGGQERGGAAAQAAAKYHCPMHPSYVSERPGDCPICGMKLVPIEEERTTSFSSVPGRAPVKLSAQREQLIGVRTQPVEKRPLEVLVRAAGRVAYDPDLYNSIAEYKEALRGRGDVKDSPLPEIRDQSVSLVRSAALRLRQMGISDAQIRGLAKGDQASRNLLVGESNGKLWVYAQVFQYESAMIHPGQRMEVTSSAIPGRRFQGEVVAVDTILNADTRTLKVRAEVPNPEGLLKHEMFVDAVIHVDLGTRLAIPDEAVMDTGTRQLAFVKVGEGLYEPREIQVGHEAEGYDEVLSGLKEGEEVVTSANFLIDSESRLKAVLSQTSDGK